MLKRLIPILVSVLAVSSAFGADLTITMSPPSTYEDGTPVLGADTITCNLYGGNEGQALVKIASGPCTTFTRTNVDKGVSKCYSATAYSSLFAAESAQITPATCITIPVTPQPTSPPINLTVTING